MRIAILAHPLASAGGLTVGTNLIKAIINVAPDHEYLFFVPEGKGYEAICMNAANSNTVTVKNNSILNRLYRDYLSTPRTIKRFDPAAVFAMDASLVVSNPSCPQFALVHSPHLVYPSTYFGPRSLKEKLRHWLLKHRFSKRLGSIDSVICQTEVMSKRIRKSFGYAGAVSTIGMPATESFLRPSTTNSMPTAYERSEKNLKLFYATKYYPHKNIEILIEVFDQYRNQLNDVALFITIGSDKHPNVHRLKKAISDKHLNSSVVLIPTVRHDELQPYYRHADGLLMPTTLETYGLPYVEAMSVGLPILTSDLDFAHAVCGDAALYFDPWNARDIWRKISKFQSDIGLRQTLAERGRARVKIQDSSWDYAAGQIMRDIANLASCYGK